ncbi:MAG: glycosyltransferase, partial [Verrucomicrobiota bacterium]|nr:glycosyltransferase [Verrucomicrobiota bacterium]
MKVCDLTQFYSPVSGGVKRYVHEKIAYVQQETAHEHVLIVPGAKTECSASERSRVYTIHSPLVSRSSRYRALINLRAIENVLERERPDIIESADPYQLAWKAIASGEALRIPVVGFYHSHFPEAYLRSARRYLGLTAGDAVMDFARRYVRKLYNCFAATFVPSDSLAKVLQSWGVENVRPVTLGVNTNVFTPSLADALTTRAELQVPEARRLLLYVGRLASEKNTKLLFRAFDLLNAEAPGQFHLLVIGDGPDHVELRELQGRVGHISWLPYCAESTDLARYYRAADLFVHPGTQETFGLVALESQACGTPVVGIRGSYMDRIILHDQETWADENTAESLARTIALTAARNL